MKTKHSQVTGPDGLATLVSEFKVGKGGAALDVEVSEVIEWTHPEGASGETEIILRANIRSDGRAILDFEESLQFHNRCQANVVGMAVEHVYDLGAKHLDGWGGECPHHNPNDA